MTDSTTPSSSRMSRMSSVPSVSSVSMSTLSTLSRDKDTRNHAHAHSPTNRQPLACIGCRKQKLKCLGGKPCQRCDKRGESVLCGPIHPSDFLNSRQRLRIRYASAKTWPRQNSRRKAQAGELMRLYLFYYPCPLSIVPVLSTRSLFSSTNSTELCHFSNPSATTPRSFPARDSIWLNLALILLPLSQAISLNDLNLISVCRGNATKRQKSFSLF